MFVDYYTDRYNKDSQPTGFVTFYQNLLIAHQERSVDYFYDEMIDFHHPSDSFWIVPNTLDLTN